MLARMWLFATALIAAVALFYPRESAREWMHERVAEVKGHTFGFQPDGKDYWYTVHTEGREGKDLRVGQAVEVSPVAFERDGTMRARVRR